MKKHLFILSSALILGLAGCNTNEEKSASVIGEELSNVADDWSSKMDKRQAENLKKNQQEFPLEWQDSIDKTASFSANSIRDEVIAVNVEIKGFATLDGFYYASSDNMLYEKNSDEIIVVVAMEVENTGKETMQPSSTLQYSLSSTSGYTSKNEGSRNFAVAYGLIEDVFALNKDLSPLSKTPEYAVFKVNKDLYEKEGLTFSIFTHLNKSTPPATAVLK